MTYRSSVSSIYIFHGGTVVVISHGLVKGQLVPLRDINKAVDRKAKFDADPKRYTFMPEA